MYKQLSVDSRELFV